ncbi:MAG: radical SAM protein, partial [Proteobacteria bacterium]
MHDCRPLLEKTDFPAIKRAQLTTLQVNLGYLCNQTCVHCHVDAGPRRTEIMQRETVDTILDFLRASDVKTLDLTGGAPEMNPHFRYLVDEACKLGVQVIDRCNLTILSETGYEGLAEFLAEHKVEVSASLPCYLGENVDAQRGKGVFTDSIAGLKKLNALGYGVEGSALILNLVYNPTGTSLPPSQTALETAYKKELKERFDIVFNQLFTITNMPIKRFGSWLISKGEF